MLGVVLGQGTHTETSPSQALGSPCCVKPTAKCHLSLLSSNSSFSCVSLVQKDNGVWLKVEIVQRRAFLCCLWANWYGQELQKGHPETRGTWHEAAEQCLKDCKRC